MKRIVLTTFGSYGDLHPYLAVARGGSRARTGSCERIEALL